MIKALIFSLLIHGLIYLSFFMVKPIKPQIEVVKNSIEINLVEYEENRVIIQNKINDQSPEDTKYLSSHNQKVLKPKSVKKQLSLQDLIPKMNYQEMMAKKGEVKNLQQAAQEMRRNLGEHIEELEEGEETLVSSREFIYFSFYMRIKERLEQVWQPSVRAKINQLLKQGKHVLYTDRKTKLLIFLNDQGSLTKVQVLHNSGVEDLDQEAVNAFKAAEPFPNPPKGMLEKDGTIRIRWDFIVDN